MKMRESKGLKATASVLLAVFLSALAVGLSGLYTLLVYYRVMDADGFRNSYVIASRMSYDIDEVVRCYQYEVMEEQGIPLSSYQQKEVGGSAFPLSKRRRQQFPVGDSGRKRPGAEEQPDHGDSP